MGTWRRGCGSAAHGLTTAVADAGTAEHVLPSSVTPRFLAPTHRSLHKAGAWLQPPEVAAYRVAACSPERPFMLDIGSNIGSYGVLAAAMGCQVVLLDPM
jgi:hypothetical protein